jgi:glycosyltransferase involved in cell wall biosynthesis
MIAVSVILCTHNPRLHYLRRVLDGLRNQTTALPPWELLLVDNASTLPLAESVDLSWHPHFRHIREMTLGAAWARLRGITEARGNLLVFVDDDTVLKTDYLAHAQAIASEHLQVGAWSGSVRLQFEKSPPEWLKPYYYLLSYREVNSDAHSRSTLDTPHTPWGGGLCLRRDAGLFYREQWLRSPQRQLLGPKGKSLAMCEDIDLALSACEIGLEAGVFARLELTHLIPPERTTEEYILRLCRGLERSLWLWRLLRGKRLDRLPQGLKWWAKFIYDAARKSPRDRRFYVAKTLGKSDAWRMFTELSASAQTTDGISQQQSLPRPRQVTH